MCQWTFASWHATQVLAQSRVSLLMLGNTKRVDISFWVVRTPGSTRRCKAEKTARLCFCGTYGRS